MSDQKKKPKQRADKYEEKLKVNASFEELIRISVKDKPKQK